MIGDGSLIEFGKNRSRQAHEEVDILQIYEANQAANNRHGVFSSIQ